MTRSPVPVSATVANKDSSGAQQTELHLFCTKFVRVVQLLTHSAALAPLARVLLFSAVMLTPLINPSALGGSTLLA
jgi:hypothetical protein